MPTQRPHAVRPVRRAALALALLVSGAASAAPTPLPAPAAAAEPDQARLEKAFWVCDWLAARQGYAATPVEQCGAITEQLKHEKFGGDLDRFLAWWHARKEAEYREIDRARAR